MNGRVEGGHQANRRGEWGLRGLPQTVKEFLSQQVIIGAGVRIQLPHPSKSPFVRAEDVDSSLY